jgi:hypothetical protein
VHDPAGRATMPRMARAALQLSRAAVVAFRRAANGLDARVPRTPAAMRRAAWIGLTDSGPRCALLQLHARVAGVTPDAWEDPAFVQVWGPRFSAYVVPAEDRAVFTLGRAPLEAAKVHSARAVVARLEALLGADRMPYGEAGHRLGVPPNSLRYGTWTGRLAIRWDGARPPHVWVLAEPGMPPEAARVELVRRYLSIMGPGTPAAYAQWAGARPSAVRAAWAAIEPEIVPVRTPAGDAWILAADEPAVVASRAADPAGARLLPSGDALFLSWGADRELLVPAAADRARLWTSRVWPGAILLDGEVAGTWRRSDADVTLEPWRALTARERSAIEAETVSLPLGLPGPIRVRWAG